MELQLSQQIKLDRALRKLNSRIKEVTDTYDGNVKHHTEIRDRNLTEAYKDYEFVVQKVAVEESEARVKRDTQLSKQQKALERERLYQERAEQRRMALEQELEKQRTNHLPKRFNDYRDITK